MSYADGAPEGPSQAEGPTGGGPLAGERKSQEISVLHHVCAALGFARSLFMQSEGWSALIAQYRDAKSEVKNNMHHRANQVQS